MDEEVHVGPCLHGREYPLKYPIESSLNMSVYDDKDISIKRYYPTSALFRTIPKISKISNTTWWKNQSVLIERDATEQGFMLTLIMETFKIEYNLFVHDL